MIQIRVTLINLIDRLFWFYNLLILVRVIASWARPPRTNPTFNKIMRFVYQATEPVLAPIRRQIPLRGIDISPIVALFLMRIIQSFIRSLLFRF